MRIVGKHVNKLKTQEAAKSKAFMEGIDAKVAAALEVDAEEEVLSYGIDEGRAEGDMLDVDSKEGRR
jgi:hypothetical protein